MSRKLWEWNVVPFGLKNAPPIFQRMMDRVLAGLPFARCYIDDIVVWSSSFSEHLKHLEIDFNRVRDVGLKVHPGKCLFGAAKIDFLGHRVTAFGIQPQSDKTAAIKEMVAPKDVPGLRALLGLFSYYRKFVPHFSAVAAPLNALLKKDYVWQWEAAEESAMQQLKDALCSDPVLRRPNDAQPFRLMTD